MARGAAAPGRPRRDGACVERVMIIPTRSRPLGEGARIRARFYRMRRARTPMSPTARFLDGAAAPAMPLRRFPVRWALVFGGWLLLSLILAPEAYLFFLSDR